MHSDQNVTMSTRQAASYLGLAVKTLESWRFLRRGPAYLKLGRRVVYRLDDLDRFLAQSRIDHEAIDHEVTA